MEKNKLVLILNLCFVVILLDDGGYGSGFGFGKDGWI